MRASLILCLCLGTDGLSTAAVDEYVEIVRRHRRNCGPIAVCYCLRRLGVSTTVGELGRQLPAGEAGVSLKQMLEFIRSSGVSADAVKVNLAQLATMPSPAILVINDRHCVVYEGVGSTSRQVVIFEPFTGRLVEEPLELLQRHWNGEAIVFGSRRLSTAQYCAVIGLVAAAVFAPGAWILLLRQ